MLTPKSSIDQTLHPGDPMNRDPSVTKEQEAEWANLKAADAGRNIFYPSNTAGSDLGKRIKRSVWRHQ